MKRRRGRKSPSPGLTAMGDIAFLLITFFVLVAKMSDEDHVQLKLPKSYDIDDVKEKAAVRITIDSDRQLLVNGIFVDRDGLKAALIAEIGDPNAAPEEGEQGKGQPELKAAPEPEPEDDAPEGPKWDRMVMLRLDKETNHEMYFPILETLAELDAQVVMVAEEESGEAPKGTPDE